MGGAVNEGAKKRGQDPRPPPRTPRKSLGPPQTTQGHLKSPPRPQIPSDPPPPGPPLTLMGQRLRYRAGGFHLTVPLGLSAAHPSKATPNSPSLLRGGGVGHEGKDPSPIQHPPNSTPPVLL